MFCFALFGLLFHPLKPQQINLRTSYRESIKILTYRQYMQSHHRKAGKSNGIVVYSLKIRTTEGCLNLHFLFTVQSLKAFFHSNNHTPARVLSTHLFRSRARPFVRRLCLSRLTTSTSNQAENGHKYVFLLDFTFAFHGWTWYFPLSLSAYLGEILMQKTVTYIQGSHLCSQSTAYLRVELVRRKKLENEREERNRQRVCADKGLVLFSVPFAS